MSEEKLNIGNEVLELFEKTVETSEGTKITGKFRKWSLLNAGPNLKLCGESLAKIKDRRPDFAMANALRNLDVILAELPEECITLIRRSLVDMNEKDKGLFLGSCDLPDALELLEVILRQNFFNPKMAHRVKLILAMLGKLGDENNQQ